MKALLLLVVLAVAGWYAYTTFMSTSEETAAAPHSVASPEQQLRDIATAGSVDPNRLSQLCGMYPQQAITTLRHRALHVQGTVSDMKVAGLSGRRAELTLNDTGRLRVVVIYDLDRAPGSTSTAVDNLNLRYTLAGNELFLEDKKRKRMTRLFTLHDTFTGKLALDRVGPTIVMLPVGPTSAYGRAN